MKYTEICNDKWLFIWVGLLLFAVIAQCMLFMSKAWKHGMEIGLKQSQLKKGFKDRDHDQYHANTSGFTGVVFRSHHSWESRFRGCVFRLSALLIMKHMQQQLRYRAWERHSRSTGTARMDGSRPCG